MVERRREREEERREGRQLAAPQGEREGVERRLVGQLEVLEARRWEAAEEALLRQQRAILVAQDAREAAERAYEEQLAGQTEDLQTMSGHPQVLDLTLDLELVWIDQKANRWPWSVDPEVLLVMQQPSAKMAKLPLAADFL